MRLTVVGALILFSLAVIVETKPFFAVKVVPVPVIVPKFNVLGLVGKAIHAKAALVGHVVRAKATLLGHLLASSSGPAIGVAHPVPLYPAHPTTSYGDPL